MGRGNSDRCCLLFLDKSHVQAPARATFYDVGHSEQQERVMKATLFFCAVLFLSMAAMAQNPPTLNAQPNTVYVSAEGKFESAPDTAMVQFTISAQEESAKEAYARASQEAEQLRQILRSNGVDPKAAEIGFFSLQPVYDYRTPKRKIIGFRVTTSVSLKFKDFSKVGPI